MGEREQNHWRWHLRLFYLSSDYYSLEGRGRGSKAGRQMPKNGRQIVGPEELAQPGHTPLEMGAQKNASIFVEKTKKVREVHTQVALPCTNWSSQCRCILAKIISE